MLPSNQKPNSDLTRIKVVILEDGRYDMLGMKIELNSDESIEVIGASTQPGEILTLIEECHPDVAIIDLRIYDDGEVGVATIRDIKEAFPEVKCIVPTAFPELSNFLAAFDAGAEAFVKKAANAPRPSLPDLVRLVTAGGRYYDPDLVEQMRRYVDETRVSFESGEVACVEGALTPREREVLWELAKGSTNEEIAAELIISEHTVKVHVSNIIAKLGAKDRHEAVLLALSKGWLSNIPQEVIDLASPG